MQKKGDFTLQIIKIVMKPGGSSPGVEMHGFPSDFTLSLHFLSVHLQLMWKANQCSHFHSSWPGLVVRDLDTC